MSKLNVLILLKQVLMKNKNTYVSNVEATPNKEEVSKIENNDENEIIINIANTLGLEFTLHSLKKMTSKNGRGGFNRFNIDDNNMVFLYR